MSTRKRRKILTKDEITHPFEGEWGDRYPPILTVEQAAKLLQISRSTLYEWLKKGRLDGAYRKRGKHILLWRDKIIEIIFNTRALSEFLLTRFVVFE